MHISNPRSIKNTKLDPVPKFGMAETQPHPPHTASSTWNTSSTENSRGSGNSNSTSSSQRFNLDESSTEDIFVYKYQHGMKKGEITSQRNLCQFLDKDQSWRCSKKDIPRGAGAIEIKQSDFYNEPERSEYASLPNRNNSYASVRLPTNVKWRRLLLGQFPELYILSPNHSPSSSTSGSLDGSKENSPTD